MLITPVRTIILELVKQKEQTDKAAGAEGKAFTTSTWCDLIYTHDKSTDSYLYRPAKQRTSTSNDLIRNGESARERCAFS